MTHAPGDGEQSVVLYTHSPRLTYVWYQTFEVKRVHNLFTDERETWTEVVLLPAAGAFFTTSLPLWRSIASAQASMASFRTASPCSWQGGGEHEEFNEPTFCMKTKILKRCDTRRAPCREPGSRGHTAEVQLAWPRQGTRRFRQLWLPSWHPAKSKQKKRNR